MQTVPDPQTNLTSSHARVGGSDKPWLKVIGSRHLSDWLDAAQISLAFTTYQAGKLLLLGLNSRHQLAVFERSFERCMGLYASADAQTLWMSSRAQLWRFENMPAGGSHDRLYVPRMSHVTGDIDIHDLAIDSDGRLVFVNTLFNCLATTSPRLNFECLWQPDFISSLAAGDRCHLNGLALRDGKPKYATLCGRSDIVDGWRDQRAAGGCVIDVTTGNLLADRLSMPHSPRWHQNRLWLMESGSGWFGFIDPGSGHFERVAFCSGYARGLAIFGDWAVVGLSLPRYQPTFQGLPLDEELQRRGVVARCGLQVINLKSGDVTHWMQIENKVHELYEVVALHGVRRPAALGFITNEIEQNVWFAEGERTRHWTAIGGADDQTTNSSFKNG